MGVTPSATSTKTVSTGYAAQIEYVSFLSREDAKKNPHKLYVFGDNFVREGYGGQAKEMRGCPNAVGLVTKRRPAKDEDAYLTDAYFEMFKLEIGSDINILEAHLDAGGIVVFPKAGVGTGLAQMAKRAPKCWDYLCQQLNKLGIQNVPIKMIISGGQTGADQGGLEAAYLEGIPTGGLMPKGFKTDTGNNPELAKKYNLKEDTTSAYKSRTHKNAAAADVTLWFGSTDSAGYKCTYNGCLIANKPFHVVTNSSVEEIAQLIKENKYQIINIAGNRESRNSGIYNYVLNQMRCVINHLRK